MASSWVVQWSKSTYTYGVAMCLLQIGGEKHAAEVAELMEKVPALRKRIAGKSIPVEVSRASAPLAHRRLLTHHIEPLAPLLFSSLSLAAVCSPDTWPTTVFLLPPLLAFSWTILGRRRLWLHPES